MDASTVCLTLGQSGGLRGALEHRVGPQELIAPSCRESCPYQLLDDIRNASLLGAQEDPGSSKEREKLAV